MNHPDVLALRFARGLTLLVYAFVIFAMIVLLFGFFLLLFGATPTSPSPNGSTAPLTA